MGDEGSGYAIARQALQAAAKAADGRGPKTNLLSRFLQLLGIQQPFELIQRIHGGEVERPTIATWADVVFEEATGGDALAVEIVSNAARELAVALASVCRQLGLESAPFPLVVSGGLLIHQAAYRDALRRALLKLGLKPDPIQVVAEPVWGATILAQRAVERVRRS
jgi:N-acetylglucosamine kinase-like BadF-type ATPase